MKIAYRDITEKLGRPMWWTMDGVPRYAPFNCRMGSVYAKVAVLTHVQCQYCDDIFLVGFFLTDVPDPEAFAKQTDLCDRLSMGDPPRHGCVGDTMSSDVVRILQRWYRSNVFDWHMVDE